MMHEFFYKHREQWLYILFGIGTTAVSIGSFLLFHSLLQVNELVANVLSWLLAVGFAYATNRAWVFRSQTTGKAMGKELISFYAGRLFTLAVEEALLLIFVTWLAWNATAVKLAAQLAVLIGNYIISKWIIFRKEKT